MSAPTTIVYATIWEDGSLFLMARVLGYAATPVTQATLTALGVKVYSRSGTLIATLVPAVSSSIFDTLQTSDPRWTIDSTGYNFGYTIPGSSFPSGDTTYRAEVNFDPAAGDDFNFVAEITTLGLFSK